MVKNKKIALSSNYGFTRRFVHSQKKPRLRSGESFALSISACSVDVSNSALYHCLY